MVAKTIYRPVEPAVELELVKESLSSKKSPLIILIFQATGIFIFVVITQLWDALNMIICQSAAPILLITLLVTIVVYSCILCFPISNKTRSKIMIYVLSIVFGALYLMTAATYYAGVAILSYILSCLYVGGLLYLANTIPVDITNLRGLLIISFGLLNLIIVAIVVCSFFRWHIPVILFCGGLLSLIFSSLYLYVNSQYCGLYFGKRTKVRKITMKNTYQAHPVAYLFVGSLTTSVHFLPIIHQLWRYCEGTW